VGAILFILTAVIGLLAFVFATLLKSPLPFVIGPAFYFYVLYDAYNAKPK